MNFFTFDFETANFNRSSACAIGITAVKNNKIVKQVSQLINPCDDFNYNNIQIHHITENDIQNMPNFSEFWPTIAPIFSEKHLLVAHNLTFDVSVLKNTLAKYNLAMPHFLAIDTLQTSRHFYPDLPNHKLNTVSDYLNIELNHHEATSDSSACAQILLNQAQTFGTESLKSFVKHI